MVETQFKGSPLETAMRNNPKNRLTFLRLTEEAQRVQPYSIFWIEALKFIKSLKW
jgi:hypothetical protein